MKLNTEHISGRWHSLIKEQEKEEYIQYLYSFLEKEYERETVYPAKEDIYAAFVKTSYERTKVVILGQDPYHGEGQACGLAFSVNKGIAKPPSLVNILKELVNDLDLKKEDLKTKLSYKGSEVLNGDLTSWAEQGVLLLNTVLTVRASSPNSHKKKGWESLTNAVIMELNKKQVPLVYVLWGLHAQLKQSLIDPKHIVIKAAHPSPLSASKGFFGSKPFSKVNQELHKLGLTKIDWLALTT